MSQRRDYLAAFLLGVAYQQLATHAPSIVHELWERLVVVLVPAYVSIKTFVVGWDMLLSLAIALAFTALLIRVMPRLSVLYLLCFLIPIAGYEAGSYWFWWGRFGAAEPDYWRHALNAGLAILLPISIWLVAIWRRSSVACKRPTA